MNVNSPPSHDASSEGTLTGAVSFVFDKKMQSVDDMLPAKVLAYDRAKRLASVQILIALVATDGTRVSRQTVASVKVIQLGGGGFVLDFNLKPNDLGWIKACDRDISLFLQTFAESAPNDMRMHTFSSAVFIPDVMTGYAVAGEDAENMVIQNLAGTVKVSLGAAKIKITAPELEVNAAVSNFSGRINAGSVYVGDISLTDHGHDQVQPGGGNSGGAVVI